MYEKIYETIIVSRHVKLFLMWNQDGIKVFCGTLIMQNARLVVLFHHLITTLCETLECFDGLLLFVLNYR